MVKDRRKRERASKAKRRAKRLSIKYEPLGLIRASLKENTRKRYAAEWRSYEQWYERVGKGQKEKRFLEDREVIGLYVVDLYSRGESRSKAEKFLSAASILGRYNLSLGWKALRGWKKLEPSISREPVPEHVVWGMAVNLRKIGKWKEALMVLLCYDCYLRVGEVLNLRWEDVILKGDVELEGCEQEVKGALVLAECKTGKDQVVTIREDLIMEILQSWREGKDPRERVFPNTSYDSLRGDFMRIQKEMGMEGVFTLHGLRHGGAVRDFLRGRGELYIQLRGRWKCKKTMRGYLQVGRSQLLRRKIPVKLREELKRIEKHKRTYLRVNAWKAIGREDQTMDRCRQNSLSLLKVWLRA